MAKVDAILRYHYPRIDVDSLEFEEWTKLYNEYLYVTNRKNQDLEIIMKSAFAETLAKAFNK